MAARKRAGADQQCPGRYVASSGVTNVTGNAEGRFFTFNRDISKCGLSATLNEGPASVVYVERNEFPNQLVTKTDVETNKGRLAAWTSSSAADRASWLHFSCRQTNRRRRRAQAEARGPRELPS